MKEVKALIQPFMLDAVLRKLRAMPDLPGTTISEVRGWGKTPLPDSDVHEDAHGFAPKVKIEIVVREDQVERVVQAIMAAASTGNPGDGKLFIYDVVDVVKIRTGDRGPEAV